MSGRAKTESEAEYIQRLELEKRREAAVKRRDQLADEEKQRLKELHWMRCAKCGAELHEVEFRGVKIDKCFDCHGVYLDDGELEQLAGKSGMFEAMFSFLRPK